MSTNFPGSLDSFADVNDGDLAPATWPNNIQDAIEAMQAAAIRLHFGDGSDGNVTISIDTTLTRDMFYNSLTVNNGVTLNTGGYRIFVKGTLTNNGAISNAGGDAPLPISPAGGEPGAAGGGGSTFTPPVSGHGGAAQLSLMQPGNPGEAGGDQAYCMRPATDGADGGAGGNGSLGVGGAGGAGGTATEIDEASGDVRNLHNMTLWRVFPNAAVPRAFGNAGGAGGGGGGGSGAAEGSEGASGGGGGGNGGSVFVAARLLTNNGTITVKGGNGASGLGAVNNGGSGGGGAGGAGGIIFLCYLSFPTRGTLTYTGGSGGPGGIGGYAGGSPGDAGPSGVLIEL